MTIPEEGLVPVPPPAVLYHATAWSSLPDVLSHGLQPMGQQHVHLQADAATAVTLGSRSGRAFILAVASERMHDEGRQLDLDGRV